jgi:hypothetical protein
MSLYFSNFAKSFFEVANKLFGQIRGVVGVKGHHDLGKQQYTNVSRDVLTRLSQPFQAITNSNQLSDRVDFA